MRLPPACTTAGIGRWTPVFAGSSKIISVQWRDGRSARLPGIPNAEMINSDRPRRRHDGRNWRLNPGASIHLYGKREARVGRKMGHVTRLSKLGFLKVWAHRLRLVWTSLRGFAISISQSNDEAAPAGRIPIAVVGLLRHPSQKQSRITPTCRFSYATTMSTRLSRR